MPPASLREVLHALELDEPAWIGALFEHGRALFDEGQGLFVYSYRVGAGPSLRLGALAGEHTAHGVWQTLAAWGEEHARALALSYATRVSGLDGQPTALGAPLSELRARFEPHAVADLFTLLVHEPDGFGVFFTAPLARAVRLDVRARRSLERLAAELGAGLRLREARQRARRLADLRRLSASELEVTRLLARGASDKEIALELGVSLSTVSTFVGRARHKLGGPPGTVALLASATDDEQRRGGLFARLTAAERDVAAHLVLGRSHAEIAARRGTSTRTVAAQCALIFAKCGVAGRRALAAALLGGREASGK